MSSGAPMPVSGGGEDQGEPEGVTDPGGRSGSGESDGGRYPNPQEGKHGDGGSGGFMGHGGQSVVDYHGSGQAGGKGPDTPNAVTRNEDDDAGSGDGGTGAGPSGPYQDRVAEQTRAETLGGDRVEVFEASGVAAAEASGMTGVEGQERASSERPGSG